VPSLFLLIEVSHPAWWERESVAEEMATLLDDVLEGAPLQAEGVWAADLPAATVSDQPLV
jgi:hypothetical protein